MSRFSRRGPGLAAAFGPALALGWLTAACAPAPPAPSAPPPAPEIPAETPAPPEAAPAPSPAPDECAFRPAVAQSADTVRVLAGGAFVARQLYETLVRLDCAGRVRPGLAERWSPADGGRTWTLTLRAVRYWDGVPVTAESIAGGWAADSAAAAVARQAGIVAVAAAGDRELRLTLAAPADSVPAALADPALAVARRLSDSPWPIGTGAYRLAGADRPPTALAPATGDALRPVRLLQAPRDLRDALDAGADLVVTDDPATLAYAAARPDLGTVALPWSRTYLLVLTAVTGSREATVASPEFRQALARDAVRVDARAAAPPFPWTGGCAAAPPAASSPSPPAPRGARIAYPAGDRTARDLAARLVALGATAARTIVPLAGAAFPGSLREGRETAYVLAVPRAPLAPCADSIAWPAGAAVLPLVDTRAHAIVRRGAPPLTVDWDGTVRLLPEAP